MIRARMTQSGFQIEQLGDLVREFPDAVGDWAKRDLRPFISKEVDIKLRREPGAVHYPIEWTSEKQRLAFFATDGFDKGIPYDRSGKLVKAWHVRGDYRGGFVSIDVYNDAPQAQYVYGDEHGLHQQQFHVSTGWPNFLDVFTAINIMAHDRVEDAIPGLLFETLRHGPSGRGRARQ